MINLLTRRSRRLFRLEEPQEAVCVSHFTQPILYSVSLQEADHWEVT